MVIKEIKYFPKELSFKSPLKTSKNIYKIKKLLVVNLIDDKGNSVYGECSPLAEFGTESVEESRAKLDKLSAAENHIIFNAQMNRSDIENNELFQDLSNFPSLKFAFEQALFALASIKDKNFFRNLYPVKNKDIIKVGTLIGFENPESVLEILKAKYEQGYRTIKLKCGRDNFDDDLNVIEKVAAEYAGKINLRLDLNGKWGIRSAKEYLKELERFDIQYVEQPVNSIEELSELSGYCSLNIAADESIKNFGDAKRLLEKGIKYLIIKPTVAGGIINTIRIIEEAEKHGANVIISSSFESEIGISYLSFLSSLTKHDYAHGIGVSNLFENNIAENVSPVVNGEIHFDINKFPPEFKLI